MWGTPSPHQPAMTTAGLRLERSLRKSRGLWSYAIIATSDHKQSVCEALLVMRTNYGGMNDGRKNLRRGKIKHLS